MTGGHRGVIRNLSRRLKLFSFQGAQHPLGPKTPLKVIDSTAVHGGRRLSPKPPPLKTPLI